MNETIIALATPPLKSALAVIRCSGGDTFAIVSKVFSQDINDINKRTALVGKIIFDNKIIDEAFYKSTDSLNEYLKDKEQYIINNEIDLVKVKEFVNKQEVINPHKVNPIYIKEIEANKDGKRSVEPRFQ